MKIATALSLATLLVASTGSIALAQDAGATPGADGAVTAAPEAGATMAAGANAEASYEGLISALGGVASIDIGMITSETEITIIGISTLEGDDSGLDAAMAANADAGTALRSEIEANAALMNELEAAGHTVDEVVAIATPDGAAIVYVDDRA
ncbi:hypothetical protein EMQ25_03775 [Arsenicitalea aurantiaca]|uniref:DUF541 domain-containing protein n=1 Tax=Arsenicitalea aurantiaca TaxID=1783274 RepID=A0A433XLX2_9HYPH|nr:hypothetical protein [Arsenicitalea aurantiaca]RUT35082.1 hypothetical protein EMQ25_03775 [Arsenicitalea aurantiaca]